MKFSATELWECTFKLLSYKFNLCVLQDFGLWKEWLVIVCMNLWAFMVCCLLISLIFGRVPLLVRTMGSGSPDRVSTNLENSGKINLLREIMENSDPDSLENVCKWVKILNFFREEHVFIEFLFNYRHPEIACN